MGAFFARNIDRGGRHVRAWMGLVLLIVGGFAWPMRPWVSYALLAGGLFCFYQAGRGWCLARACGIPTRI